VFKLPDAELLDGELPLFRLELFVLAERSFVVFIEELELFIRLSDPL
jgi:hypothetical protein